MKKSFTSSGSTKYLVLSLFIAIAAMNLNAATSHKVLVASNNFNPSLLTVTVGDTVTWINTQGSHNVNGTKTTFSGNPEAFGNSVGSGWTYTYVFKTAGTYNYQCDPHSAMGMTGKVLVNPTPTSYKVTVSNNVFTPAQLSINAGDTVIWTNIGGFHNVNGTKATYPSNPESFGNSVASGWTYTYVFNTSGSYDYQCDPHKDMGMVGKITVNAKPGTGEFKLTVNFTGMTPHVGQKLWLAVIDKQTGKETARTSTIVTQNFKIETHGIMLGKSYSVDFFADHNKNGSYNAPSTDHAWRLDLPNVTGDATLNFAHNTNFTDISWKTRLMLHFTGFSSNVNQKFTVYLKKINTGTYSDTLELTKIAYSIFDLYSYKLQPGASYNIDFYADVNGNGKYDPPATDQAWRVTLNNVVGDTTVNFARSANYTDIFGGTTLVENPGMSGNKISIYPNPAKDFVRFSFSELSNERKNLRVFSVTGNILADELLPGNLQLYTYNVSNLTRGIYFFEIGDGNKKEVFRILKE